MAMQTLHVPPQAPQWAPQVAQNSLRRAPILPVPTDSWRRSGPCCYDFPERHRLALGSCIAAQRWRAHRIIRRARRRRRESSDSEEENLEKWLPFVAAGVFGLLALTPTLIVGSMAAWWSFAIAATVGSLLYFSVAVPMMITAALVGGIIIPIIAANFLVAGSLIATLLASLATAGAAGLLVWVSLGNPLPQPDFLPSKKMKDGGDGGDGGAEVKAEVLSDAIDDPFTDWDRRFAERAPKGSVRSTVNDFESLKRQGAPTYLNVSPEERPQGERAA